MPIIQNAVEVSVSHTEAAHARIEEIRAMRQVIPNLVVPTAQLPAPVLTASASVPPELVEFAAVARASSPELVHGSAVSPEKLRDLMSYAMAYEPFAAELEALAKVVRYSVAMAKNTAGSEALTTYALAQRLAKRQPTAHLAQHVAAMRRILSRRFKSVKAEPEPQPEPQTPPVTTKQ